MDDFHHLERLRDVMEGAELHGLDGVLHRSVSRHQDDLAVDEGLLRVGKDLEAVPARHDEVREDDVDVVLVDLAYRLGSGSGGVDVKIRAGEDVQKEIENIFIIFRNEEGFFHYCNFTLRQRRDGRSFFSCRVKFSGRVPIWFLC